MRDKNQKIRLYIGGMTCVNCQNKIETTLRQRKGIISVSVSYDNAAADIVYEKERISLQEIIGMIDSLGYQVISKEAAAGVNIAKAVCILVMIVLLYGLLQSFGILNLLVPGRLADAKMGYGMLFLIGILTSVHCLAMCGGINLSQCIPQKARGGQEGMGKSAAFYPALVYNAGRVLSYTAAGFVLGLAGFFLGGGTKVGISVLLQSILKMAVGLLMVVMGINMLGLFPWLRKVTVPVPRFLARKIAKQKNRTNRPFLVGICNGFMPCGPLQSMWMVALAAGNPFTGALAMFMFSLGTVPLMLGIGSAVSLLGKKFTDKVTAVGAILVVVLGLAMFSQGGALSGWLSSDLFRKMPVQEEPVVDTETEVADSVQVVNSVLSAGRYPDITVRADVPVKWVIDAPEGSINGCNGRMLIQEYGIEYTFHTGENVIEFTPADTGTVHYSCWMGMIRGNIFVTEGA